MPKSGLPIAEPDTASTRIALVFALLSGRMQLVLVAGIAACLYLFRLGTGALLDWDEAIYAQVSREMAASGNWLSPTWAHQPFFEKPPLLFWLQAGAFHFFGVSEFWARLPSALAAVGVVLLTCLIARRLASPRAGVFAAFALMTMNHFDRAAREGMTDALLCLCIFLAIYAWVRLRREQPIWFYVFCAAIGLGAMIKGPAVLVAPLAVSAGWFIDRNPEKFLAARHYFAGALLVSTIVTPWHVWMVIHYGHAFVHQYIGIQIARRITTEFQSAGGPEYYLRIIFFGAFPWSLVALIALGKRIWARQWSKSLMWAVVGVIFIGYSLLPTGHQWYILPIYPALAIEVGCLLADAGARWRVVCHASVAVLAAGIIVAFIKLEHRQGDAFTNQVAQLAAMAGCAPHASALLVVPTLGSDPQLYLPTAVFYSNRQAMLVAIPADSKRLAGMLKSDNSLDAVIQNGSLSELSRSFTVHLKAQNDTAAYAEISAR